MTQELTVANINNLSDDYLTGSVNINATEKTEKLPYLKKEKDRPSFKVEFYGETQDDTDTIFLNTDKISGVVLVIKNRIYIEAKDKNIKSIQSNEFNCGQKVIFTKYLEDSNSQRLDDYLDSYNRFYGKAQIPDSVRKLAKLKDDGKPNISLHNIVYFFIPENLYKDEDCEMKKVLEKYGKNYEINGEDVRGIIFKMSISGKSYFNGKDSSDCFSSYQRSVINQFKKDADKEGLILNCLHYTNTEVVQEKNKHGKANRSKFILGEKISDEGAKIYSEMARKTGKAIIERQIIAEIEQQQRLKTTNIQNVKAEKNGSQEETADLLLEKKDEANIVEADKVDKSAKKTTNKNETPKEEIDINELPF